MQQLELNPQILEMIDEIQADNVTDRTVPNPITCDADLAMKIYDLVDDTIPFLGTDNIEDFGTIKSVKVKGLISIESMLYEPALQCETNDEVIAKLPIIYKVGKRKLVADGNHYIARQIFDGQTKVTARVINLSALIKSL